MNQPAADALPDAMWDAAVVGAGPAGCVAATLLARSGHRVVLLERHQFPRDKVCGDALTVASMAVLERLGALAAVRAAAHEVNGLLGFSPSQVELEVPARYLTLRRAKLDALLATQAVGAGARFGLAEAVGVEGGDGAASVALAGSGRRVRARFVVLATGARAGLARRLGLVEQVAPNAVGVRCYVRSRFQLDRMVTYYLPGLIPGYFWMFPLGGGEYNVGCGALRRGRGGWRGSLRRAFDAAVAELPLARDLFRQAESVTPLGAAMLRWGLGGTRRRAAGNVLAIGETIASTLPFTGEGVAPAMRTGELAAAVVHEALASGAGEPLRDYSWRVEAALRPQHQAYALAQAAASRRWLNDFLARLSRPGGLLRGFTVSTFSQEHSTRAFRFAQRLSRVLARLRRRPG